MQINTAGVQWENAVGKEPAQFGWQAVGLAQHGFDVSIALAPNVVPPPVNATPSGNAHAPTGGGTGSAITGGCFIAGIGGGSGTAAPGTPAFNVKAAQPN